MSSTAPSSAIPAQFTTTHPAIATVLPPLSAATPPLPPAFPPSRPLLPPIEAYAAVRPHDPGSTADRMRASAERNRVLPPSARPNNASRSRTAVLPSPVAYAAHGGSAPPVLQLHAQSSSSSSSQSLGSASSAAVGPGDARVAVCCLPYAHPALKRGKWPLKSMSFTHEEFKNIVKSLQHWGLVFTVDLPRSGSVFRSFGEQVVRQLESHGIRLPGYDPAIPWETPHDLPFVLLAGTVKDIFTKIHTPYDSFNELQYTYAALTGKRPPLTSISCPVDKDLMGLPFFRIAPRYGDLQAPLENDTAYRAEAPGLDDYLTIPHRERPHVCFPRRVTSCVVKGPAAACVKGCPTDTPPASPASSEPSSPVHLAAHAPISTDTVRPAGVAARACATRGTPPAALTARASAFPTPARAMLAPSPVIAARYLEGRALLDAAMEDSPSPQSPFAQWLGHSSMRSSSTVDPPPLALPEPLQTGDQPASAQPAMDNAAHIAASSSHTAADFEASAGQSRRPRRESARMTPYCPPPGEGRRSSRRHNAPSSSSNTESSPTVVAPANDSRLDVARADADQAQGADAGSTLTSAEPHEAQSRGHRRTYSQHASPETLVGRSGPPSNRRRLDEHSAPASPHHASADSESSGIRLGDIVFRAPLRQFKRFQLSAWADRLIADLPPPSTLEDEDYDEELIRPYIKAKDPKQAAKILIFLVQWLFAHGAPEQILDGHRAQFQSDFAEVFPDERVQCSLVPLVEILRHARHLHIVVSCALGDSPIRAVIRHAVKELASDARYWQPLGRFRCIQWMYKRGPRPERDAALATAGFIAKLHFVVLLVGPDPFSPFLILNALRGMLRIDEAFMCGMDVGMWQALRPLIQFDTTLPLPSCGDHPLHGLLIATDINPAHYGSGPLSSQDLEAVEQILVSHMVLGAGRLADELDMIAFTDGFFAGHARREDLVATFGGLERDYLAAMCNQRLDDVDELLKHIHWESAVDHSTIDLTCLSDDGKDQGGKIPLPDSAYDSTYEVDFQIAFRHYIRQAGHPDTKVIREMTGDAFQHDTDDALLRARLFLTMMSGSDLKPVEEQWQIKINFTHTGVRDPEGERDYEHIPAAIDVHACFYECTVTMDDGLRNLLDVGTPWLEFQSWLHGALLNPDDYNQA